MLYYFKIAHGNFGDALNPWLWSRLAPEVCDEQDPALFLAIGTILSARVPAEPVKVVFGSGCGPKSEPSIDQRWFIYGVRGPRTAARLKLSPSLALADPAILIRRIALPPEPKKFKVSFMLHHQSTFEADWRKICSIAGFHIIDPRSSVDQVLAEIQQTELLVTEAMHGAIVADALRVPWIPVRIYAQFVEFKWRDWADSLSMSLEIAKIPPVYERPLLSEKGVSQAFRKAASSVGLGKPKWRDYRLFPSSERSINESIQALKAAAKLKPQLSSDAAIGQAEERLATTLEQIRSDWRAGKFSVRG